MKSQRFNRGRYVGGEHEIFQEGKIYRGKFDVYEQVILIWTRGTAYQSSPENWTFKEEWKTDETTQ